MRRPISIFIAEDNQADLELFREAFKQNGIECDLLIAEDGQIAATVIAKLGAELNLPDLAIIDWFMPKISGLDLLRLLRANKACANLPILVATASISKRDSEIVATYGAIYFPKPSDWPEFVKVTSLIRDLTRVD